MASSIFFSDDEVRKLGEAGRIDFSLKIGPAEHAAPAVKLLDQLILDLSILQPEQDVSQQLHDAADLAIEGASNFEMCFMPSSANTGADRLRLLFEEAFEERFGLLVSIQFYEQLVVAKEILADIKVDHPIARGRPVDTWLEIACAFILKLHKALGGECKIPYDKASEQKARTYPSFGFVCGLADLIHVTFDRIASTAPFEPPLPPPTQLKLMAMAIRSKAPTVKPLRNLLEKGYARLPEIKGSYMMSGGRIFRTAATLPYPGDEEGAWVEETPINGSESEP